MGGGSVTGSSGGGDFSAGVPFPPLLGDKSHRLKSVEEESELIK